MDGQIDIINSTLGKAMGGASGGYTTGPKQLVDLLRNRSRPYLFSNTLPPPVVACANKVGCNSLKRFVTFVMYFTKRCWSDQISVFALIICSH